MLLLSLYVCVYVCTHVSGFLQGPGGCVESIWAGVIGGSESTDMSAWVP